MKLTEEGCLEHGVHKVMYGIKSPEGWLEHGEQKVMHVVKCAEGWLEHGVHKGMYGVSGQRVGWSMVNIKLCM